MVEFDNLQELVIAAMDFLGKNTRDNIPDESFLEVREYKGKKFIDLSYYQENEQCGAYVYFGCIRMTF
jgi:hypothetical protein